MYAEFIQFYAYSAEQALTEYAKRFFGLVNTMYRLQAKQALTDITTTSAGMSGGKEASGIIDSYTKQAKGNHGILQEVRIIKDN